MMITRSLSGTRGARSPLLKFGDVGVVGKEVGGSNQSSQVWYEVVVGIRSHGIKEALEALRLNAERDSYVDDGCHDRIGAPPLRQAGSGLLRKGGR
jgi:hypothetical protein